jgi:prolyl-tRNA synthetase
VKFKNKEGKEEFVWQTCYGPAISRILASVISMHGDDAGLIIPYSITPFQVVLIPIFNAENKEKILKETEKIQEKLEKLGISSEVDSREKRPGEKYYEWELKGVPFRLEIGEKELENKELTLFTRDTKEKEKIKISDLKKIAKLGIEFDKRLLEKADKFFVGRTVDCKTKQEVKKVVEEGKIARVSFCSTEKDGVSCAEIIEKEINADVRGTLANKNEKVFSKCPFCNREASKVVYIGRSY